MYKKPIIGQITFFDVKNLSWKRLKVLQKVEEISEGYAKIFCRDTEKGRWFVDQEHELFMYRFSKLSKADVELFFKLNDIKCEKVSTDELNQLINSISAASKRKETDIRKTDYYKVNFLDVIDLVKGRKAFISSGIAYINFNYFEDIISMKFKEKIPAFMVRQDRMLSFLQEEERLIPLLKKVTNDSFAGKVYNGNNNQSNENITPMSINQLCKNHFPPWMRNIHSNFKIYGHLKHGARLQYTPSLRRISTSLDNTLSFFRYAFGRTVDFDRFNKQYAYKIEHIFRKKGIIERSLTHLLTTMGISIEQINKIHEQVKNNRFGYACSRIFEFSHKMKENSINELIVHPNRYFEMSCKLKASSKGGS
uniref:DNA primase large subunit (inferred by orthology to a D. melanogaster protein) n=1 Tax=Strongyloides venezuelensis TaxID=75913 RepID=A0A0K0FEL7_STRVS